MVNRERELFNSKAIFMLLLAIIASGYILNRQALFLYHFVLLQFILFLISKLIYKDTTDRHEFYRGLRIPCGMFAVELIILILGQIFKVSIDLRQYSIFIFSIVIFILFNLSYLGYYKTYPMKIKLIEKMPFLMIFITYLVMFVYFFVYANREDEASTAPLQFLVVVLNVFLVTGPLVYLYNELETYISQLLVFKQIVAGDTRTSEIIERLVLDSSILDLTLQNVLSMTIKNTNSTGGAIYLYDDKKREFECKKLEGYIHPPFFISDKVLTQRSLMEKRIFETRIAEDELLFKTVVEKAVLHIKNIPEDSSRFYLKALRDYADQIDSLLVGSIVLEEKLIGVLIVEKELFLYDDVDVNTFTGICNFIGVLIRNVKNIALEKEKERLGNEMKIAERIQTAILPKKYDVPGYDISAFMKPAEEVGGDYYDIFADEANDSHWVNIGDVSGHGLTPGLIMLMLQTVAMSSIYSNSRISPDQLIIDCNKVLYHNIHERLLLDHYATSLFFNFTSEGNFSYSGVHIDFFIYRHNTKKVENIKPLQGMWLGMLKDISDITVRASFKLEKGDVLLLCTDGVIECTSKEGEIYDIKRTLEFLEKHGEKTTAEIRELLYEELEEFQHVQDDDITYIVLKKM